MEPVLQGSTQAGSGRGALKNRKVNWETSMSDTYRETAKKFIHRHEIVGTSSAKLNNNTGFTPVKGILLRAPGAFDPKPNTACIWVGGAAVTADSAQATGGMPIAPGESFHIPSDLIEGDIYLISSENDQDISWIGV